MIECEVVNHAKRPLVSVIVAAYDGDVHLLSRALKSVAAQTIGAENIEVLIAYDGPPSPEAAITLDKTCKDLPLDMMVIWPEEKTGYYTVPRNRALPFCRAPYVANLDADNEWAPFHLRGLVAAMRTLDPQKGWPMFAYARRTYVLDEGAKGEGSEKLPTGDTQLIPWNDETVFKLNTSPNMNFIDTSDFLMARGAMYELGEITGFPWNPQNRRFGDWEFFCRVSRAGMWGVPVDQVSNIYHWTGANLQTGRWLSDITVIPESVYNKLMAEGVIDPDAKYEEGQ